MTKVHGKGAVWTIDGDDLSAFSNNIQWKRSADSHDTTCFGSNAHTFQGGLLNGTGTITGVYDDGASGPRAIIEPLLGTVVTLVYKPEGTGTGKPQDSVSVLVTGYDETAPVADMISWTCTVQMTGDVTTSDQS